jgi:hypothetical protein
VSLSLLRKVIFALTVTVILSAHIFTIIFCHHNHHCFLQKHCVNYHRIIVSMMISITITTTTTTICSIATITIMMAIITPATTVPSSLSRASDARR